MTVAVAFTRERLERAYPEAVGWLALVAEAQRAFGDPAWTPALASGEAEPAAPLLAEAVLRVDEAAVRRALRRFFAIAAENAAPAASLRAGSDDPALDALAVLEAAVRQDQAGLEAWAARLGAAAEPLSAVAALAATPLLHACWRAWGRERAETWGEAFCPVCGAWPLLVEARGLDRSRRLRCGRCGADWRGAWLRCVFCGNPDHARLGSLVAAEGGTTTVETCEACHGYLKSITTLSATPAADLALLDLATLELDLAARERGHGRPATPGYPLHTRLVRSERAARP
jgi:FdhE protein